MRRTFNEIISCFIVLYPIGLIFYKVNHSCKMSCTDHITINYYQQALVHNGFEEDDSLEIETT